MSAWEPQRPHADGGSNQKMRTISVSESSVLSVMMTVSGECARLWRGCRNAEEIGMAWKGTGPHCISPRGPNSARDATEKMNEDQSVDVCRSWSTGAWLLHNFRQRGVYWRRADD